jgi:hypothetical protein
MKKVVGGYLAVICLIILTFLGIKQYFFSIGYTQPLFTGENGVSYIAKVDGKDFYVLDG